MMSVALWPTILVMIGDVWRSKRPVTRDVEDRLYSKLAYLVTKVWKQTLLYFKVPYRELHGALKSENWGPGQ
jgi:hypothetical protein